MKHSDFFDPILSKYSAHPDHPVVQYLSKKTIAVERGSKARRSLGNLYALAVLAEDYASGKTGGTPFTKLLLRMKDKPFGSKLQNHPLDNRLNGEFKRQFNLDRKFLPVQSVTSTKGKTRKISHDLLTLNNQDPLQLAMFIVDVVSSFSSEITSGQNEFINQVESLSNSDEIKEFFEEIFSINSDARLFEVSSFCILKFHYINQTVTIEYDNEKTTQELQLFKTGRTNANDGGIDFVLKPVGRFFQVTETLDFKKYFLDFEKVNRFPLTFVIKQELTPSEVLTTINNQSKQQYDKYTHDLYMSLFDEIITSITLREYLNVILDNSSLIQSFLNELIINFKLEYGHYD